VGTLPLTPEFLSIMLGVRRPGVVYGGYAIRLLRLQLELIQTLDRHRRGNKQTVEVRHVHIHSGARGWTA
jgi:hypothetical protein